MKEQEEQIYHIKVARSYDKASQWAQVCVTEHKTIYLVTIHILGYALPSVQEWRISKKDASSIIDAVNKIAHQAYMKGIL